MSSSEFIAVDWGTTNRRTYRIRHGEVIATEQDGLGVSAVAPGTFASLVDELRARHGGVPVVMAGMVGSNRGWIDAGYRPCPATLDDLARALASPGPDVFIVPGVKYEDGPRADVMRGEEVQLLGAAAAGLVPGEALLCQPGTHAKWATLEGGALARFATAMTGEMFAMLKAHSLIGAEMTGPVDAGPAFREGVEASAEGDLLRALFGVRAAAVLGRRPDAQAAAFVSGLLIGTDCRARLQRPGQSVHLLADGLLADLYSCAIALAGGQAVVVDSHAAFLAGITRIGSTLT